MRVAELIVASCILAASGAGVAAAQFVEPLRNLEAARRDRLEMDKRLAREAVARRRQEQADQATRAKAQREQRAVAAAGAPDPLNPSPAPQVPSARETLPGAPVPAASLANARGTAEPIQPAAPSNREQAAPPLGSPAESANGPAPSGQPGPSPVGQIVPGSETTTTPASGTAGDSPAPSQPAADVAVAPPPEPPVRVVITVDKAAQRMRVTVDGKLRYTWPVSTGRAHFETPAGAFRPLSLVKLHHSREWDGAPMPYTIFFTGRGHAIHATNATRQLGRPASHGCVRLAPSRAAALFALVRAEGPGVTRITIANGQGVRRTAAARAHRQPGRILTAKRVRGAWSSGRRRW